MVKLKQSTNSTTFTSFFEMNFFKIFFNNLLNEKIIMVKN